MTSQYHLVTPRGRFVDALREARDVVAAAAVGGVAAFATFAVIAWLPVILVRPLSVSIPVPGVEMETPATHLAVLVQWAYLMLGVIAAIIVAIRVTRWIRERLPLHGSILRLDRTEGQSSDD